MVRRSTASVAAALLLLGGAPGAEGQRVLDFAEGSNWLAGFTVNAPQQILGAGTMFISERFHGFGLYLDGKVTHDSPAGEATFISNVTPEQAEAQGDFFFRDDSAWATVNVALVKGIGEELALYVGGGYAQRTVYAQYIVMPDQEDAYWIEDGGRSETHANFLGGAFFRMSNRIAFQFGAEAAPKGFTAGMHVRLR